jgi:acyl carrier protein
VNAEPFEQQVRTALYAIAPDIEGEPLDADVRYRDQFEFDSMDFLRFIMELHRLTGVEIPESDYPRLQTLNAGIAYLREKAVPHE